MLSKILDKKTCGECRFCCSFRRCSLWETPLFPMETVKKIMSNNNDSTNENNFVFIENNGMKYAQMWLLDKYKTNDSEEEVPCDYLDCKTGCTLDDELKPFDCKIWPLRIMQKGDELVIALTPTCPAVNKLDIKEVEKLVREELADKIFEYAREYSFIVKEYKEGFPIIHSFN